jgi:ribosomal protein L29
VIEIKITGGKARQRAQKRGGFDSEKNLVRSVKREIARLALILRSESMAGFVKVS